MKSSLKYFFCTAFLQIEDSYLPFFGVSDEKDLTNILKITEKHSVIEKNIVDLHSFSSILNNLRRIQTWKYFKQYKTMVTNK